MALQQESGLGVAGPQHPLPPQLQPPTPANAPPACARAVRGAAVATHLVGAAGGAAAGLRVLGGANGSNACLATCQACMPSPWHPRADARSAVQLSCGYHADESARLRAGGPAGSRRGGGMPNRSASGGAARGSRRHSRRAIGMSSPPSLAWCDQLKQEDLTRPSRLGDEPNGSRPRDVICAAAIRSVGCVGVVRKRKTPRTAVPRQASPGKPRLAAFPPTLRSLPSQGPSFQVWQLAGVAQTGCLNGASSIVAAPLHIAASTS